MTIRYTTSCGEQFYLMRTKPASAPSYRVATLPLAGMAAPVACLAACIHGMAQPILLGAVRSGPEADEDP